MKHNNALLTVAVFFLISGFFIFKTSQNPFFVQEKVEQIKNFITEMTTEEPVCINDSNYASKDYLKKNYIPDELIPTSPENRFDIKETLMKYSNANLIGIRCTENIIRDKQGIYYFEDSTKKIYDKRAKDQDVIKVLNFVGKKLPHKKKLMNTRLCEMETGKIIVVYTAGDYTPSTDPRAGSNPLWDFTFSKENVIFIKVINPKNLFERTRTVAVQNAKNSYLNCSRPFALTKDSNLIVECREIGDYIFNYFDYQINLQTGKIEIISKCLNIYKDKWSISCEAIDGQYN